MPVEYEAKVLNINPDAIIRHISDQGGQDLGERLLRRYVYDIDPNDQSTWIRLRDNGTTITLAIKEVHHDSIAGTQELEIEVSHFALTNQILTRLGFTPKSYQENRRHSFTLNGTRLEIDTWPHIPPYLEIEAGSEQQVLTTAQQLGFTESDLTSINTMALYRDHGIDLATVTDLRFA